MAQKYKNQVSGFSGTYSGWVASQRWPGSNSPVAENLGYEHEVDVGGRIGAPFRRPEELQIIIATLVASITQLLIPRHTGLSNPIP